LALRYHGHQFHVYNAALDDGRGFLFAQLHAVEDGRLLDLATKGSGQTPWSPGGDRRLTLKGGVREVLATAMLEASACRRRSRSACSRPGRSSSAVTSRHPRARRCWCVSVIPTFASARSSACAITTTWPVCGAWSSSRGAPESPAAPLYAGPAFGAFRRPLEQYAARHPGRLALPYWQRAAPCTLLIDDVEALWAAIAERDDWGPFEGKLAAIEELRSASDALV
jgi:hypothetical protein